MLLVSHRPLGYGGVGATRWGYMMGALRELGWEIETVSPPPNPTADEMSSDESARAGNENEIVFFHQAPGCFTW